MRIDLQFLKAIDRKTALYAAVLLGSIAGTIGLTMALASTGDGLDQLRTELTTARNQANSIRPPTLEELAEWSALATRVDERLLPDGEVTAFLGSVTRLASQNRLEDFDLDTEEHDLAAAGGVLSGTDALAASIGVLHYTRLTVSFNATYQGAARFIDGISRLGYLTSLTSVDLNRISPEREANVSVTIDMNVYQDGNAS
jgi:Tfp pilus assembly protein PilO